MPVQLARPWRLYRLRKGCIKVSHLNALEISKDFSAAVASRDYVTMLIGGQLFGIPVLQVQDVLNPMAVTRVPLAPPEVFGVLNLRGRIVTAIDVRTRLGLGPREAKENGKKAASMNVVVDHNGELYSLQVDQVGEVISCPAGDFEPPPATLDPCWRQVSAGVYRLSGRLLIVLDIGQLLNFTERNAEPA